MHKRRMLCSSSTTSSRIRESSLVTDALLENKSEVPQIFARLVLKPNSCVRRRQTLRADGRNREADQKCAALCIWIVVAQDLAVMRLDDSVANAQAQAGAFANRLGRKKRLKDTVGV